ncbi:DUF4349 domain-containing protein [Neobacillus dielmonensis]|uniref:DUF4349 domain-containing protein n=1 Tax=Neobacillus dielmonensis TaxID=1347369 RepID=UPI0005AB91A2|nr:DUF4349 domain-containing protein [Neobacillus dielmonensis]
MNKQAFRKLFLLIFMVTIGLAGCSSSSKNESSESYAEKKAAMAPGKSGSGSDTSMSSSEGEQTKRTEGTDQLAVPNQMVIYQANLQIRVKNFDQTVNTIEKKVQGYGGYIAESTLNREGDDQLSGTIRIRIPQQFFQDFLHDAEGAASEVLQRDITGQDVTEEYVDLQSRLKSKRVVEERLTSFMQGAAKTEDLLKISEDLAAVQEEIETIEGRMKFLENQTAFSTITITLYESKVVVPKINPDKLNTWGKTKQQFMQSTNWLLAGLSGLVVLVIGNLPIITIMSAIGIVFIYLYKRRNKRNRQE